MVGIYLLAFFVHYVLFSLVSSSVFRILSYYHEPILIEDYILLFLDFFLFSEISLLIDDVEFLFLEVEVLFLQIILE